jgi:hypothetical protein
MKNKKQRVRKCETCGGWLVETGQFIHGMRVLTHESARRARRCLRIEIARQKEAATERLFAALDKTKGGERK